MIPAYATMNQKRTEDLLKFTKMINEGNPFRAVKFNDGEWNAMTGRKGSNCDNHGYGTSLSQRLLASYCYLKENSYLSDYITDYPAYDSHTHLASNLGTPPQTFVNFAFLHDLPRFKGIDCRGPELKGFYGAIREDSRTKIFVGPKRIQPEQFLQLRNRIDVPMLDAFNDVDRIISECVDQAKIEDAPVFLMSCGFVSCILSEAVARANPRATVIDLGSAIDPILFGRTRKSQLPTSELRNFYRDFVQDWGPMPHYHDELPGWFNFEQFYSRIIRELKGGRLVEVGSWMGKSAAYLAVEAANSGKKFTIDCVDHFEGSKEEVGTTHKRAKTHNIKGLCASNLRPFWSTTRNNSYLTREDNMLRIIPKRSSTASRPFKDKSIVFCFLDAGHTKEEVLADIEAWMPKIKPGGILAGHDLLGAFPGVRQAVEERLPGYVSEPGNCWSYRIT